MLLTDITTTIAVEWWAVDMKKATEGGFLFTLITLLSNLESVLNVRNQYVIKVID